MKLEDLKAKKISDLCDLLVDKAPIAKIDTSLSKTSLSITESPYKMVVGVDDSHNVIGVLTGTDIARTVQQRSVNPADPTSTVINKDYVGVDVSDTISDLVLRLSMRPVRSVVVTDKGKYVGIIDRQKLAKKVEELLR